MSARLLFRVLHPDAPVHEVSVEREIVKIGRAKSAHLVLDDPAVGRMHAVIEAPALGEMQIIDLGNEAGTSVNGRRVAKSALRVGDEIGIGPFRVIVEAARSDAAPRPPVPVEPVAQKPSGPMECPRCRATIREMESAGPGGVYRGVAVRTLRCEPCAVTFLAMAELATSLGRPGLRLSGSFLDRGHVPTRSGCPACRATMDEVTLSWSNAWVVVEECTRCGMLALDEGEVDAMAMLAGEATDGATDMWARAARGAAALFEHLESSTQ